MAGENDLRVRTLSREPGREFADLARIYRDVLPASERKGVEALRGMLGREDYVFSVADLNGETVGFAIRARLAAANVDLLEYMGVSRTAQGRGVGRVLFAAAAAQTGADGRILLLEVEAEGGDVAPAGRRQRERRRAFYRDLGCREVSGLAYILPNLSGEPPPPMAMLVHGRDLPASLPRADVGSWLQATYTQVYGRAADDPAIAAMLSDLPDEIALV